MQPRDGLDPEFGLAAGSGPLARAPTRDGIERPRRVTRARIGAAGRSMSRREIAEIDYRVPQRIGGAMPGHHDGRSAGEGDEFRSFAVFGGAGDARHLALKATARDPLGRLMVRRFNQRSQVPVYVLADLSASMAYRGHCRKLTVLADFVASLAFSARKTGDPFGFIGCGSEISEEWVLPLGRNLAGALELAGKLDEMLSGSADSRGLLEAGRYLSPRTSLVFLASDFYLPLPLIERVLTSLSRHHVVPLILRDSSEERAPDSFGLVRLRDIETGASRLLFVRPSLRARLERERASREDALHLLLMHRGLRPLVVEDSFRPDEVNSYFQN